MSWTIALSTGHGHTELTVRLGEVHGWRCRARLAVRGRPGRPVVGLYRAGTHDALDIPDCRWVTQTLRRQILLCQRQEALHCCWISGPRAGCDGTAVRLGMLIAAGGFGLHQLVSILVIISSLATACLASQ